MAKKANKQAVEDGWNSRLRCGFICMHWTGILASSRLLGARLQPIHFSTSGLCCGLALVNFAVKIALVFTVHLAGGAFRAALKPCGAILAVFNSPESLLYAICLEPGPCCHRQLLSIFTCTDAWLCLPSRPGNRPGHAGHLHGLIKTATLCHKVCCSKLCNLLIFKLICFLGWGWGWAWGWGPPHLFSFWRSYHSRSAFQLLYGGAFHYRPRRDHKTMQHKKWPPLFPEKVLKANKTKVTIINVCK